MSKIEKIKNIDGTKSYAIVGKDVEECTSEEIVELMQTIGKNTPDETPKEYIWQDLKLMLDDIRSHPYPVEINDNLARHRMGYKCTKTDKRWEVPFKAVTKEECGDEELAKAYQSQEGKRDLLDELNAYNKD